MMIDIQVLWDVRHTDRLTNVVPRLNHFEVSDVKTTHTHPLAHPDKLFSTISLWGQY